MRFDYKEGDVKIETSLSEADFLRYHSRFDSKIKEKMLQNSRMRATQDYERNDHDIGVIPNVIGGCPSFSEPITFFMDCEDNKPATKWNAGTSYTGSWVIDGNKNVTLRFCRASGTLVPAKNIMVLRLGSLAPPLNGSPHEGHPSPDIVVRNFDNEDNGNTNYSLGVISPNVSNSFNTTLQFYFYPSSWTGTPNPGSVTYGYGVIGNAGSPDGQLYTDDEDNGNGNYLTKNGVSVGSITSNIIGGSNTTVYITKIQ